MLKVWNRLPALTSAGALLGLLALTSACGEDEDPPASGGTPTWEYVSFPDAFCRDGSPAGISISASTTGSKKLMIYLEGGGACFDQLTCIGNPATVSPNSLQPKDGLFARDNAENPVKDWNLVYVPYCTGDNHTGTKADGVVDGVVGTQKFVGYNNMTIFLKHLKEEFPDMERVFLTGISAGGFGAAGNVPQVTRTWPDAKGNLIDDSGPAMSTNYIVPCLQAKWNQIWGLDQSIIKECGATCKSDDFVLPYSLWLADKYSKQFSGMIETTEDAVIRGFYGIGYNYKTVNGVGTALKDCNGNIFPLGIPAETFKEGLLDFREQSKAFPNFGTFFPAGAQHTWLGSQSLYTGEVSGVRMIDWVKDIVTDTKAAQVGP